VTQPITLLTQLHRPPMCSVAEIFFVKPNGKKTKAWQSHRLPNRIALRSK